MNISGLAQNVLAQCRRNFSEVGLSKVLLKPRILGIEAGEEPRLILDGRADYCGSLAYEAAGFALDDGDFRDEGCVLIASRDNGFVHHFPVLLPYSQLEEAVAVSAAAKEPEERWAKMKQLGGVQIDPMPWFHCLTEHSIDAVAGVFCRDNVDLLYPKSHEFLDSGGNLFSVKKLNGKWLDSYLRLFHALPNSPGGYELGFEYLSFLSEKGLTLDAEAFLKVRAYICDAENIGPCFFQDKNFQDKDEEVLKRFFELEKHGVLMTVSYHDSTLDLRTERIHELLPLQWGTSLQRKIFDATCEDLEIMLNFFSSLPGQKIIQSGCSGGFSEANGFSSGVQACLESMPYSIALDEEEIFKGYCDKRFKPDEFVLVVPELGDAGRAVKEYQFLFSADDYILSVPFREGVLANRLKEYSPLMPLEFHVTEDRVVFSMPRENNALAAASRFYEEVLHLRDFLSN